MWLKVYYAFSQLSAISIIIGIFLTIIFYKKYKESDKRYNAKLVLGFVFLTFLCFGMLSLTGHYPQLCFNLGNRVTIFGSLLLAYLIVLMPVSHKLKTLVFALIIFTTLGISDHWKNWNVHKQKVITNIKNNRDIENYQDDEIIYVSGNQYSKYGPISHVEFLSEGWAVAPLFELITEGKINAIPINKCHKYENGYLVDQKYGSQTAIGKSITIYDSEKNTLFILKAEEINSYVDSLPPENRHWIQFVKAPFIKNMVTHLMPRLKYSL